MQIYYLLYLVIFLGVLFLLIRYLLLRRALVSTKLFIKGIRWENGGFYDEAAVSYEQALSGMKKGWLDRALENKIKGKLKLLHTISIYKRDQAFVRENNSWIS